MADRSEAQWPAGTAVSEGLRRMANDVRAAADTAGGAQNSAHAHHQADIERHDAPRGGRAAESRWDVARTDDGASSAAAGRHRAPDQRKEHAMTAPDDVPNEQQAAVPDLLGVAGTPNHEEIIGSDQVPGQGKVPANVMLADWDSQPGWEPGGKYVVLETPQPQERDPTGAPLSPAEAGKFAGKLDDLAGKAEQGLRPPKPSKYACTAQRIEDDIKAGQAQPSDKVMFGDGGEDPLPLTNQELLELLRRADPEGTKDNGTRTHVVCRAAIDAGSDQYAAWAHIRPDGRIAVTAIEGLGGSSNPDDEFWQARTSVHNPDSARELAGKLRTFAAAAHQRESAEPESAPSHRRAPDNGSALRSACESTVMRCQDSQDITL